MLTDSALCGVGQAISIDILPDDVLLAIFDFFVNRDVVDDICFWPFYAKIKEVMVPWQSLVHVCRRWRGIVFGSPRRLGLRLVFKFKMPASDTLNLWPALPFLIYVGDRISQTEDVDNIITVLERRDRVNEIYLCNFDSSPTETVLAAMQEPFPELTHLLLRSTNPLPALPDSFLGGSAPRLRHLWLTHILSPSLPKLLLSATHLVSLRLEQIPYSEYISPEAMVIALSTSTSLRSLILIFHYTRSRPDWTNRRPPPPTRTVLHALKRISFEGVSEYLDDLFARIDAPRLETLFIFFVKILSDTPQFIQFISRMPMLRTFRRAWISFGNGLAVVDISSGTSPNKMLQLEVSYLPPQVSYLGRVFTPTLRTLSTLEDLYIIQEPQYFHRRGEIENTLWLELLRPFSFVKNLYLGEEFIPRIGSVLQEPVGERTTEVLPNLQNIFLERLQPSGPVPKGIGQFVTMRQVNGHPIAVSRWDTLKPWQLAF